MRKYIYCIIACLCQGFAVMGQSHGLEFSSHEVVPEHRTALDLTPGSPYCLKDGQTEIAFQLAFRPHLETYFGYILRMLTDDRQNIDLVYNQRTMTIHFVIGETITGSAPLDSSLLTGQWLRLRVELDAGKQTASFYCNDKPAGSGKMPFKKGSCARIFFGAIKHEGFQTLDVPPMRLRDVRLLENGAVSRFYPLNESGGQEARDEAKGTPARATNPVWIKPRHQQWQNRLTLETTGTPSVAYNEKEDLLYVVTDDTLFTYSFRNGALRADPASRGNRILPAGNQSVYDPHLHRILNFYIDEKKVATLTPGGDRWSNTFYATLLTEWWQANKFYSPADSSLYIIGGYGQLHYKNTVQRYRFRDNRWDSVPATGDAFSPRYLAGLGLNAAGDTAFIIGGYGSNTGDQAVNPRFTYDMMAYSVETGTFKHLYTLPQPEHHFCFANSLIIDSASREYYGLIYPTDRFQSSLQLVRGSLSEPEFRLMGDSLPYQFYDIGSFADLYYSPLSRQLIAVTIYNNKDSVSGVRAWSLDFPPNALQPAAPVRKSDRRLWLLLLPLAIVLFWLLRKKKKTIRPEEPRDAPHQEVLQEPVLRLPEKSAVFLFGQFEAFDREGNDITKQFTPLLKELFLLLVVHSMKDGKGISSESLYETLWSDKSPKDAKNNFSVNMVKLKGVLEKIGVFHAGKEPGRWKLEILEDSAYIDYAAFVKLTQRPAGGAPDKQLVVALLEIVQRGAFLRTTHYEWLDDVKFQIAGTVSDVLLRYMSSADKHAEADFILRAANAIFLFDHLNEEALAYKCRSLNQLGRHSLARDAYEKFAKEYKESYGQEYGTPFVEVLQH
ncbi:hypothetical protein [Chitinophaga sp.]|uniref:hypothetical protein n=1 Tax=Chitinophaga sp. TaxID=1869181 RepID=UPI00262178C7|nr:hypothetical protein [uncultured Chitinophaga sp.]